jgi:transcriptional regulator with XRE-family HTH domain
MMDEIRKLLVARRRDMGISQNALSARMGLHGSSHISALESGHIAAPTLDTIDRWCRALDWDMCVTFKNRNIT